MLLRLLALLGLLAASAALQCNSTSFKCKDESECISGIDRCCGHIECSDGSDEENCDAIPTVALPAHASVTARMQFDAQVYAFIELLLCGSQHCSKVELKGVRGNGTLRYRTQTSCTLSGRDDCKKDKQPWAGWSDEEVIIPTGEVVLEVEHRPGELTVWRQERRSDKVTVPVEADYGTLKIRPLIWGTDMPVQFSAHIQCSSGQFQCKDGNECVSGHWRCDGHGGCGDDSDEAGCDAIPAVALPVNAWVTARVQFEAEHDSIKLLLCAAKHCSMVWLDGVRGNGTLRHRTREGCNLFGIECSNYKNHAGGSGGFPPGEVVLEVQHRPGELAVWRQGRPDDTVTVRVKADYSTLKVRPYLWGFDMPVQFSGGKSFS